MPPSIVAIGSFEFDTANFQLSRGGETVALGTRATAVLGLLVEARGRTVRKAELLERCWPGVIVEESNLTVQIAALRKLLGATESGADFIVTVPRVGYRLAASCFAGNKGVAKPGLPVLATTFFAHGRTQEEAGLAIGLRTVISAALARVNTFALAEPNWDAALYRRTAELSYHDLDLQGIGYLLEGSLQRAASRLRVNVRLLETRAGGVLWSDYFDGTLEDCLMFEDRVAFAVAAYVEAAVESAEYRFFLKDRPESLAAYDLYLKAQRLHAVPTPESYAVAFGYMLKALEQEPDNGTYASFAADLLARRISEGWRPIGADDKALTVHLAKQVLRQDIPNPFAMSRSAAALIEGGKEYELGMITIEAAADAAPNGICRMLFSGTTNLHCGDLDLALKNFREVASLGSRTPYYYGVAGGVAHAELARGNYEAAIPWAMRSLAANSTYNPALWMLISANAHLGRMEAAREYLTDLKRIVPTVSIAAIANGQVHQFPERIRPMLAGLKQAGLT